MECDLALGDGKRTCRTCGALLPRGRRLSCSNLCADLWAINHNWQRARLAVLERDGLVCRLCGASTLEPQVDHIVPVGRLGYTVGCQHHQENLRTLCPPCHRLDHRFPRQVERVLCASGAERLTLQLPLPGMAA